MTDPIPAPESPTVPPVPESPEVPEVPEVPSAPPPPEPSPVPRILREDEHPLRRDQICREALKVMDRLHNAGYKAYLCGGGVRDLLLGRQPKDFDVVTDARPEQIKRVVRNTRIIGRRFRLAHCIFGDVIIETATFRALLDTPPPDAENVPVPTRRRDDIPDPTFATRGGVIVRDNVYGTPSEDARRRDFTVNGLFYDPSDGTIIDYVGGLDDLHARILRVIGDPAVRYHEDPVRMLRAIRIASQLDFEIEPAAREAIIQLAGELRNASRERMHEEMLKVMNCGASLFVFDRSWRKGLFQVIYPTLSRWLETPQGDAKGTPWVRKAFHQFDVWKKAGLKPMPALQYSLLFGALIEQRAAENEAAGAAPYVAAEQAVDATIRDAANLPQLPKAIMFDAERILGLQVQLKKAGPQSKYATRVRNRRGFNEALIYLKFAASLDPLRKPLLQRWL